LLMPVVEHNVSHQKWDSVASKGIIWNFWSDDMGISWNSGNNMDYPVNAPAGTIMQEPGVVELKNGDILMYMRTSSHVQYISHSKDHGVTWSPAEPSNIASPRSPAVIKRIPSTGDLIMVWNNNGESEKRTPLSVAISRNNGESWEKTKNIEDDPSGSFSYPAIHFTNNDVLVSYCAKGLSVTYISRLSLDWIYK
jgi:sialidase-1